MTAKRGFAAIFMLVSAVPAWSTETVDELLQQARETEPNVKAGQALFRDYCVECHGRRGQGNAARKIPIIANQRQAYIIKQFADLHEGEREAPPMHAVLAQSELDDMQAWVDVAAYVNALAPVTKGARGDGKSVDLGETVYRQQCSVCHGKDARGDDDGFVPSLRNQHYDCLLDAINALAAGHRTNVEPELMRALDGLDGQKRTALADYLSRMRGKTRDLTWLRDSGVAGD